MNCLGLAPEWERCEELRERLRIEKRCLLHGEKEPFCLPTRPNAVKNAMVLKPVLARLAITEKFKLPHLEDLKVQVQTLFDKCGTNFGEKEVYKTSVEIKKLAGFIKRRAARKEVTKEKGFEKKHV